MVDAVNQYRAAHGLGALSPSAQLAGVAEWLASDLAAHNLFGHVDSIGRDFPTRITACGINTVAGENLAAGFSSAQDVMKQWEADEVHNVNLLDPTFTKIGVGIASGGQYGNVWVVDFAQ